MIATVHVTRTATDWVRLGENRIAILAGPVEQVEANIVAFAAPLKIWAVIFLRAKARGYRPIPSLEFQFNLVRARFSIARWRKSDSPHDLRPR